MQDGVITENELVKAYSMQCGFRSISEEDILKVDQSIVSLLPEDFAKENNVIALSKKDDYLAIAMEDPEDLSTLDSIRKLTNLNPEILVAGKTSIETAIKIQYGKVKKSAEVESAVSNIVDQFNCKNVNNLFELIGAGSITSTAVLKKIYPELKFSSKKKKFSDNNQAIKLKGLTLGMSYHLADCCSPIKGDKIVGIVTAGIGVAVHTIDCDTLNSYSDSPERWLDISWDTDNNNEQLLTSRINIILSNKAGSLGKVTTSIAKNNGNISNINFASRKKDFYEIIIDIEVRDKNHLNNIIAALRLLSEVSSLERLKG